MKIIQGEKVLPNDYGWKWFVLFSHPAGFTSVSTTEFVAFQKGYDGFRGLNCELIGLSVEQVFSHLKWVEWIRGKLGVEIVPHHRRRRSRDGEVGAHSLRERNEHREGRPWWTPRVG